MTPTSGVTPRAVDAKNSVRASERLVQTAAATIAGATATTATSTAATAAAAVAVAIIVARTRSEEVTVSDVRRHGSISDADRVSVRGIAGRNMTNGRLLRIGRIARTRVRSIRRARVREIFLRLCLNTHLGRTRTEKREPSQRT